jgi:hypothetical protein
MNFRRLILTGTLAFAVTGLASAAQITQTFSMPSGGGSQATNWSPADTATINQFNTSLGTLEYVEVIAQLSTTVNGSAVDASGGSTSYQVGGTTSLMLNDSVGGGELLVAPTTFAGSTFLAQSSGNTMSVVNASSSVTAEETWFADPTFGTMLGLTPQVASFTCGIVSSFSQSGPGCLGYNEDGTAPSSPGYPTIQDPLAVSAYEGLGTLTLTGNASTSTAISGGPVSGGTVTGTASPNVTVIYDYTVPPPPSSTPEPATMALFGSGLVALGLIRRRISKKA